MTPPSEPAFSILLLTYDRPALAVQRVEELKRFVLPAHADITIEILDNGSPNSLPIDLAMACAGEARITLSRLTENIGFGPGFNHLAERATGKNLVFLSDDVQVFGDFIPPVAEALDSVPNAIVCHQIVDWKAGWNVFGPITFAYPQGYFLACRSDEWGLHGGFDERFVPAGYEDVDLGYRWNLSGFPVVALKNLPVTHQWKAVERMEHTILMRRLFAEKWGLLNVPERP